MKVVVGDIEVLEVLLELEKISIELGQIVVVEAQLFQLVEPVESLLGQPVQVPAGYHQLLQLVHPTKHTLGQERDSRLVDFQNLQFQNRGFQWNSVVVLNIQYRQRPL